MTSESRTPKAIRSPLVLLGVLLAALAASCSLFGTSRWSWEPTVGPYDHLPAEELARVAEARELLERGEELRARELLSRLAARHARNVPVAIFLQEVELRGAEPERVEQLVIQARERADTYPTPVTLLLAARLEPDTDEARALIERALAIDPECAWGHYALAHREARAGDWVLAQERLDRALELDPGHLTGRRLEAGFLAREGRGDEAIEALEQWLEATADNPLIAPTERFLATLDLAQLYLLDGDEGRSRDLLIALADEPEGQGARRLCILAVVEQARGKPRSALRAARRAEQANPSDPLPLLQQALLLDAWLDDPQAARKAWERLLEIAAEEGDLRAVILGMRARVALERSEPGRP